MAGDGNAGGEYASEDGEDGDGDEVGREFSNRLFDSGDDDAGPWEREAATARSRS